MTGPPDGERSGLRLLHDAREAFAARLLLVRSARRTLDIQYYIWRDDLSGALLLQAITEAAGRGVKVRLLLDDNGIAGLDARLALLAEHANIAVRLFNPFALRRLRALDWLFAYRRRNTRMHAKSLTADGEMTIIGGRNVGDEYFGAQYEGQFDDLDVLGAGPVAAEVEQVFEAHWQAVQSRELARAVGRVSRRARRRAARRSEALVEGEAGRGYMAAVAAAMAALQPLERTLAWAPARVVATLPDPHAVRTGDASLRELLPQGLARPRAELIVVSGYFVPTASGCAELGALSRNGARVRVLTNSFAATDVGVVHAGYAPCRPTLLRQGVELFEMPAPADAPKTTGKFIRAGSGRSRGHSGKSLHAKVYVVDGRQVYVGSANFDPRSARINTELGFFVESMALASRLAEAFDHAARNSYRLGLAGSGALTWTDERDDDPQPESVEPGTSVLSRLAIRLLSKLSLDDQL